MGCRAHLEDYRIVQVVLNRKNGNLSVRIGTYVGKQRIKKN